MAKRKRRADTVKKVVGHPPPSSQHAPGRDLLTMPLLASALGLNVRALERFQTRGIIAPAEPRRGARPSRWDLADCARKILAHKAELTPRDRRERAQAQLLELRYRRESREVLERAVVIRKGLAVAKTLSAFLTSLPSRMVKDELISPEHEPAIDTYLRERLDELSRLADERYLAEDDEHVDDQP